MATPHTDEESSPYYPRPKKPNKPPIRPMIRSHPSPRRRRRRRCRCRRRRLPRPPLAPSSVRSTAETLLLLLLLAALSTSPYRRPHPPPGLVVVTSAYVLTSLPSDRGGGVPASDDGGGGGGGEEGGGGGGGADSTAVPPHRRGAVEEMGGKDAYRRAAYAALGVTVGTDEGDADGVGDADGGVGGGGGYGADVTFPVHRPELLAGSPVRPLGDRRSYYESFVAGCREYYAGSSEGGRRGGGEPCDRSERRRMGSNLMQPPRMENYTEVGFAKVRVPEGAFRSLRELWDLNRRHSQRRERWDAGSTLVNHWDSPTYSVSLEDRRLEGGGDGVRNGVWDDVRAALSRWTGAEYLNPASMYGIRAYRRGAVVAPHVDRPPLVLGAVINVAQDVDEPWPLELYGRDGMAYNVTAQPGDMVLYEGHSIVHGRPFPLRGKYYADVYVHFEPVGHTMRHELRTTGDGVGVSDEELYRMAMEKAREGVTVVNDDDALPSYILRGTPEERRWRQRFAVNPNPDDADAGVTSPKRTTLHSPGVTDAHRAASDGEIDVIRSIASNPSLRPTLFSEDRNGWQPLHEAARGGHTEIVRLLVEEGADVNARTNQGRGANALWWAESANGRGHPVSKLLRRLGAVRVGPDVE